MAVEASRWPRRLWGAAAIAAFLATALLVTIVGYRLTGGSGNTSELPGGPFTLTTQAGGTLSDTDLKGKPFAVFFGFTHCPEVCPTTLWEMSEALKALGPEADKLKVLFVSVDPERDTPEFLARYLQSFDPRIVGLTGSEQQIADVGREYRAFWRKVPTEDGDYTMDHTASIYLMNGEGRYVGTIAYGETAQNRLAKLKKLLDPTASGA